MKNYDSREDTLKHIYKVRDILFFCVRKLHVLAVNHDKSKLEEPEKRVFDEFTPRLKNVTFGSEEYKKYLNEMGVALNHHYKNNNHHPEYFNNGIKDMNLINLIEMFCDWFAATKRHKDGDILKSIKISKKRFEFSDELEVIFNNTAKFLQHFDDIETVFNKDDSRNVRKIVYDWVHGLNVDEAEYKNKYSEIDFKKAKSIILILLSNGISY